MAEHRHKRETAARRQPRATTLAASLAVLATVGVVAAGVAASNPTTGSLLADTAVDTPSDTATDTATQSAPDTSSRDAAGIPGVVERPSAVTRSASRSKARAERKQAALVRATTIAVRRADTRLWTTAPLNLWTRAGDAAKNVGELPAGERVLVTGRKQSDRTEIVLEGKSRWVTAGYLSEEKPVGGECTNGTSVPSGVSPNIVKVHDAVCGAFPEISTYGTLRSDGEHSQGLAVDIMVSGDRGWQVANYVRENYAELGVSYVIYSQNIWSVERSGEGWRGMPNRGTVTANHYDHVHVTTY